MKNNFCIIMAGGIGSRFWPISRNSKPKQFLDFFGTGKSLLQMTYERFLPVVPAENILIVSNNLYKNLILEQLPGISEEQILLEPMRRNTAPCIAYAVNRIKAICSNANIIVAPSDHLILKETEFVETIKSGIDFVAANDCLLTLGIKPSRPETGYGYIQISEGEGALRKVKTFTEKPNLELASVFLESGEFYWNSGMFLWNLQSIDRAYHEFLPEIAAKFDSGAGKFNTVEEKAFIDEIFPECQNISIDYGVLEKAPNVFVLCADFGWSDLGTWGSLYELSDKDTNGNCATNNRTEFYGSSNNIVAAPAEKLVVIDGLEGYLVAETDDVLLICKKDEEQKLRQIVNDISIKYNGEYI